MKNHKTEAEKHVHWAHEQQASDGEYEHTVRDNALLAQVHAMLYLADQQRVVNEQNDAMIELARAAVVLAGAPLITGAGYARTYLEEVHPDVARLLGLGGESDE